MATIEVVAARVEMGSYASVVVVVHRPGSTAIQQSSFFDEFSSLFESAAIYSISVFVISDLMFSPVALKIRIPTYYWSWLDITVFIRI